MNQNGAKGINSDEIKLSEKNKKSVLVWQILFLGLGSIVAVLLFMDNGSSFLELGVSAYWILLLIPTLFAFPISIKKSKLLLIPIILFPLTVIAVSAFMGYFSYVLLYCWLLTIIAIPGIAMGFLIRLARNKRIFVKTVGIIALVVILVMVVTEIFNPLRRSNEQIRANIFELTPIGTSKEQVIDLIETNGQWHKSKYKDLFENMYDGKYQYFDYGYAIRNGTFLIRYHGGKYDDAEMIGKETIKAPIGTYTSFTYGIPFDTTVYVYWAFDENSNLIDIAIKKDTDGF